MLEDINCSGLGSTDLESLEQNKKKLFMPKQIIMKLQATEDRKKH